ncbi:MAG: hypothetical protein LGB78_04390 [Sulfurovum sp.]|nr:hypothetical protein [Sulfurovum sp.]MCB4763128.1 hypothetical protein [Sulfurovum sp.]MCB4773336.1 hypothetical protein [Sulfurovum sp.]MCB4780979.1 hypothetical protein [Sulfurovum sp.]MCB4782624.1 hypothetical protein [Sulfurovum sp.]
MSLIIVGYDYEMVCDRKMDDGVFAIADSAITSYQGGRTILNGFRKVYEHEAKIWKPSFNPYGDFLGYHSTYSKNPFLVGFAGSTLTAQHILNGITGHLEKLKIIGIKRKANNLSSIKYKIIAPCEENHLITPEIMTLYDESTFLDSDYKDLLTGELIAEFISHSINTSLKSASRYKLDIEEFKSMHTDFFCGVWCPKKMQHEIYIYRMKSKKNEDGVLYAYTEKAYLNKDKIAVLGMRKDCEEQATSIYNLALEQKEKPSTIAYKYLNECIDKVQENGSKEIDRPISFRKLKKYKITKIK